MRCEHTRNPCGSLQGVDLALQALHRGWIVMMHHAGVVFRYLNRLQIVVRKNKVHVFTKMETTAVIFSAMLVTRTLAESRLASRRHMAK